MGVANYCVKNSDLLECVAAISPSTKLEGLTQTGSIQQFPVTTRLIDLPTKQEQPFQGCVQIPDQLIVQGNPIDSIFPDGLAKDQMAS